MRVGKTALFTIFVVLFMFSIFSAFLIASDASGTAAGSGGDAAATVLLQARAQQLSCRIDFENSVTTDVAAAVPAVNSQLLADESKFGQDKSQLASLASAGDANSFESFVQGTLTSDMNANIANLKTARQSFQANNVTNDTRTQLKSDYDNYLATMKTCEQSAMGPIVQARINQYTNSIASWNDKIAKYNNTNYDISAMEQVLSGATSNVIGPLQDALSSGDSAKMKSALKTYCLRDGCDGDTNASIAPYNYHLDARMAIEVAAAAYGRAEALSANATSVPTTSLDSANQEITAARSVLAQVGTAKYSNGQDTTIQSDLKQAAKDIQDYTQSIRTMRQTQRQNRIANGTRANIGQGMNRTGYGMNGSGYYGMNRSGYGMNRTGINGTGRFNGRFANPNAFSNDSGAQ